MPRELQNLEIEEISLVDEPAVPKAKFLIVKRNQEETEVQDMSEENISKQTVPDELKKVIATVIDQIKEAIRGQDLPKKAKDLIKAALESLEAITSEYGYPPAEYGYPAPESYPPPPQKSVGTEKAGRRFSKENEDRIREIYRLAKELLDQIGSEGNSDADVEKPWEVDRESEVLAKCVEIVNQITEKLGGR